MTNALSDTTASSNTACLYRVRAVNSSGTSAKSAPALATTVMFTDSPLAAGTTIVKAGHLAEIRTAVDAVRALAGKAAGAYTDPATAGIVIKAIHVTELRSTLDDALSVLGLSTGGYTIAVLTGIPVKGVHFQEFRDRVR